MYIVTVIAFALPCLLTLWLCAYGSYPLCFLYITQVSALGHFCLGRQIESLPFNGPHPLLTGLCAALVLVPYPIVHTFCSHTSRLGGECSLVLQIFFDFNISTTVPARS